MYSYTLTELFVTKNELKVRDFYNLEDELMINFLNDFEKRVYVFLKEKKTQFKYVLSSLEHNVFQESIEYIFEGSKSYNIFNLTQHPRYVGSIIIENFINYNSSINNYVICFENPIAQNWLNSKVNYMDVIRKIEILVSKTTLKNDIKITFIRIYSSDLITFKQVNLGSKTPLFKIDD